ncbi:single-stranded DNA-binding protein [Arcanobacterium canis]
MNDLTLTAVGNLTADPELKYVGSGTPVASFTIAHTDRVFNKQANQWEDGQPTFIRCTCWRDLAENATETLSKGMRVIVTGRLQVRNYQRNDGTQGTSVEMQVEAIGPDLRYATAQVTKTNRNQHGSMSVGWTQPTQDPAGNLTNYDENPPF